MEKVYRELTMLGFVSLFVVLGKVTVAVALLSCASSSMHSH